MNCRTRAMAVVRVITGFERLENQGDQQRERGTNEALRPIAKSLSL